MASIYGRRATMKKDGRTLSPFYSVWTNMKTRCYNKHTISYKDYGGRGIKVCDRWLNDVSKFIEDMEQSWYKGASLDRIDVNGNYEPGNCRWATKLEQANNTRRNRYITYNGKTMTLEQWIETLNLKSSTIRQRIYVYKWDIVKAFETPIGKRRITS